MFAKLNNKLSLVFSKSWNFLRPRQKLGLVSFVFVSSAIISAWLIFTPVAQAGIIEGVMETFADIFFALAGFFIKLTFFVLKFIIEVAGYNGFIDSSAVIVGWVMVRDVTNMFFVVVLLIISFGTILGLERYEYKKLLVKLIMAAVIVNFSRVICGLIIDIAQVVMITFVNGIAATASGNLVNMFQVDQIFKLAEGSEAKLGSPGEIFLMGVAALTFSVIMLVTMLTFLFLLMARMAMLWVLIVLSPFAFVLNVLPQTEKYASQWWGEFGGHVVAGPIIAFFLWLSFVTVGSGTAHDEIVNNNGLSAENAIGSGSPEEESTGLGEIMSWEKMANFAIAIAMLLAGAKMAQQLGVVGGSMMGKAGELGKKVAMYASGVQAARWGAKKGWDVAKKKAPIIGTESLDRKWRSIKAVTGRVKSKMPVVGDVARAKYGKWLGLSGEKAWKAGQKAREKGGVWNSFKGYGVSGLGWIAGKTVGKVGEGLVETTARSEKRVKKREDLLKHWEETESLEMGFSDTSLGKAITKQANVNKVRSDQKDIDKAVDALNAQADRYHELGDTVKESLLRQQAASFGFNKLIETFKAAGANANERANISGSLVEKMKELTDKGGNLSDDEAKKLKFLRQQHTALTAYNASQGAYDDQEQERQDLKALRWTEDITDENTVRRFISRQLGRVVNVGEEASAWKEWEKSLEGKAGSQAVIRQLAINAKGQIAQGNKNYASLFREEVDKKTGMTTYNASSRFTFSPRAPGGGTFDQHGHALDQAAVINGWNDSSDIAVTKVKQSYGTREGSGAFRLKEINLQQAKSNASFLNAKDARGIASLDAGFLGDLDNAIITSKAQLRVQLEEFAKAVKDQNAFDALISKFKNVMKDPTTGADRFTPGELSAIRGMAKVP